MTAPRVSPLRTSLLLSVASLLIGATIADAQATKKAPVAKPQEKAKVAAPADPVDVNSAPADKLAELPGVGEVTAKKIIAGRPYKTVDDLAGAGVPAPTVAKLKPLTVARPLPSPVDMNLATAERLQTLPGVGPVLAKEIIAGRPYDKFDDLAKVKGLGEVKLDELRGRVAFGKGKVEAAAEKAKAKAGAVMDDVKTKAGTVKDAAKEKVGTVKDAVKEKAGTVKEAVKSGAGEVKAKAGAVMDDVKSKAGSAKAKVEAKAKAVAKTKLAPGEKININTATQADLERLADIGEVRSKAIIEGRPYKTIDDIKGVKGIGDGIFAKIKDNITVK